MGALNTWMSRYLTDREQRSHINWGTGIENVTSYLGRDNGLAQQISGGVPQRNRKYRATILGNPGVIREAVRERKGQIMRS